ncbi:MAG: hypothetical protein EZS28_031461, partial [Streblomastix strix]
MKIIQQQQQQSDSFELSLISSTLVLINKLIKYNTERCKQIINTPNFLNSLIKLTQFKFNNETNKEEDKQSLQIRDWSKQSLDSIQRWGDEQVQVELVTNGYPRILIIVINTAGGNEQEQDDGIGKGLINIADFIREILRGRRQTHPNYPIPSLSPQPVLLKSCQEQIIDEGENEEIEAQLINKGFFIKQRANWVKGSILNFFIDNSNRWDIVQLFKKELNLFTFEKVGQIGKVPKGLLRAQIPSTSKVNQSPENSELINTPVLPRVIAKQDNTNAAEKSSRSIISKIWGNFAEIQQLLEGIEILQEDQLKDSLQQLLSSADQLFYVGEMMALCLNVFINFCTKVSINIQDEHLKMLYTSLMMSIQSPIREICEAGLFALKQAVTSIDRFRAVITPRGGFIKR